MTPNSRFYFCAGMSLITERFVCFIYLFTSLFLLLVVGFVWGFLLLLFLGFFVGVFCCCFFGGEGCVWVFWGVGLWGFFGGWIFLPFFCCIFLFYTNISFVLVFLCVCLAKFYVGHLFLAFNMIFICININITL